MARSRQWKCVEPIPALCCTLPGCAPAQPRTQIWAISNIFTYIEIFPIQEKPSQSGTRNRFCLLTNLKSNTTADQRYFRLIPPYEYWPSWRCGRHSLVAALLIWTTVYCQPNTSFEFCIYDTAFSWVVVALLRS